MSFYLHPCGIVKVELKTFPIQSQNKFYQEKLFWNRASSVLAHASPKSANCHIIVNFHNSSLVPSPIVLKLFTLHSITAVAHLQKGAIQDHDSEHWSYRSYKRSSTKSCSHGACLSTLPSHGLCLSRGLALSPWCYPASSRCGPPVPRPLTVVLPRL